MRDKDVHPHDIRGPIKIVCKHCGATNTSKAYCCITCFKVLRPKAQTPFGLAMGTGAKVLVLVAVIALIAIIAVRSWIGDIESRTQSDREATQQVQADEPVAPPPPPLPPPEEAVPAPAH